MLTPYPPQALVFTGCEIVFVVAGVVGVGRGGGFQQASAQDKQIPGTKAELFDNSFVLIFKVRIGLTPIHATIHNFMELMVYES